MGDNKKIQRGRFGAKYPLPHHHILKKVSWKGLDIGRRRSEEGLSECVFGNYAFTHPTEQIETFSFVERNRVGINILYRKIKCSAWFHLISLTKSIYLKSEHRILLHNKY